MFGPTRNSRTPDSNRNRNPSAFSRRSFCAGALALAVPIPILAGSSRRVAAKRKPLTQLKRRVSPEMAVLSHATFGPTAEDLENIRRLGVDRYIEMELDYPSIPDEDVEALLRLHCHLIFLSPQEVSEPMRLTLRQQLGIAKLIRAIYSRRQLFERAVDIFEDIFNTSLGKIDPALKAVELREVIRRYALGNFHDFLVAVARSPSMLAYLDNYANYKSHPNENFARELLELFTLGIGGYTQHDVEQVAKCFTGWTYLSGTGQFVFRQELHDETTKTVLGVKISAGGIQDGVQVLELLSKHPSTARNIAGRICHGILGDEAPATILEQATEVFHSSGGDLKAVFRVVFQLVAKIEIPVSLKRPFHYLVSALRVSHAKIGRFDQLIEMLSEMGQEPYAWLAPDGYPTASQHWLPGLKARLHFALALFNDGFRDVKPTVLEYLASPGGVPKDPEQFVDLLDREFYLGLMSTEDRLALRDFLGLPSDYRYDPERSAESLAIGLPAFQLF